MNGNGRLERIFVKRFKLGPMDERSEALLREGAGIDGNANQGGRRQVTVIQTEAWEEMSRELGAELNPAIRRANLLVSGVALAETRGKILHVGCCRLLIRGETRPCERMEEAWPGLQAAMSPNWRGGCYGEVISGGSIATGDEVFWGPACGDGPRS